MRWVIREVHDMVFRGPGARIKPRATLGLGACFSDDVLLLRCAYFDTVSYYGGPRIYTPYISTPFYWLPVLCAKAFKPASNYFIPFHSNRPRYYKRGLL